MNESAQIRAWMLQVLEQTGMSAAAWAAKAGVSPATVQRAVRDDYAHVTSTRTLGKLAAAAGVAPLSLAPAPVVTDVRYLPVRYRVGAGIWRSPGAAAVTSAARYPVVESPQFAGIDQWMELVEGDSMDEEYREGVLLHVVDATAFPYSPRPGDHVVLERRRAGGSEIERSVKEVAVTAGGLAFVARSTNPAWRDAVRLGDAGPDAEEAAVVGLVIGSYRPR